MISVVNGWFRLEVISFDTYNEASEPKDAIERYRVRTGHYPKRVLEKNIPLLQFAAASWLRLAMRENWRLFSRHYVNKMCKAPLSER